MGRQVRSRDIPASDRLLARLVVQSDGCWYWTGIIDKEGYGRIGYRGRRSETIQRAVYDCFVGPIEQGMDIDHACHTLAGLSCVGGSECLHRRCGNPDHLEKVTPAENTRRNNNSRKTHCPYGHDLSPENIYTGYRARMCKKCARRRAAESHARKLALR